MTLGVLFLRLFCWSFINILHAFYGEGALVLDHYTLFVYFVSGAVSATSLTAVLRFSEYTVLKTI